MLDGKIYQTSEEARKNGQVNGTIFSVSVVDQFPLTGDTGPA